MDVSPIAAALPRYFSIKAPSETRIKAMVAADTALKKLCRVHDTADAPNVIILWLNTGGFTHVMDGLGEPCEWEGEDQEQNAWAISVFTKYSMEFGVFIPSAHMRPLLRWNGTLPDTAGKTELFWAIWLYSSDGSNPWLFNEKEHLYANDRYEDVAVETNEPPLLERPDSTVGSDTVLALSARPVRSTRNPSPCYIA